MADDTDWNNLKAKCAAKGTRLVLRVETFADQYRFALSAVGKRYEVMYDIRANDDGHAPQHIVTQLVSQALEEWFDE